MAASGFISIPIAVAYLDKEQLGLWAVVNSILSYLVWMDLGLGDATGRKIAKAVADNDQKQLNQWWTLSRCIMTGMGLVLILLGFAIAPLALEIFEISPRFYSEAYWLILGAVTMSGISIPIRGVSGLLTAQNRFHYSPIGQAVVVWINLGVFFLMLRSGHGLISYFWGNLAGHLCLWSYYSILIYTGPLRPRFDISGCSRDRAKELLGFGLNVAGTGFVEAITNNLPAIILGRLGGLASVPIYTITARGPAMLSSLTRKTVWSFYPTFLRLQVNGNSEQFLHYHRVVGQLTLGVSLVAAGGILTWNESIVVLLAGRSFYAGHIVNGILAATVIIDPISRLFQCLMHLSGRMRNAATVSLTCVATIIISAIVLYKQIGVPGLVLSLTILPVTMGIYGYVTGGKRCCFDRILLSLNSVKLSVIALLGIIASCAIAEYHPSPGTSYQWLDREWLIPSVQSLFIFNLFVITGVFLIIHAMIDIKKRKYC